MQHSAQEPNFEMSLRDQLIAAQNPHAVPPPPAPPSGPPIYPPTSSASPPPHHHPHHHIDPNIGDSGGARYNMSGDSGGDDVNSQGRQNKRELSTSKRAAQNRAAQRAFRQRKEAYILKLEAQVKDSGRLDEDLRALQQENYQLREYILSLQARLLEAGNSDYPPPPPQITLDNPNNQAAQRGQALVQRLQEDMRGGQDRAHSHVSSSSIPPSDSRDNDTLPPAAISQLQAAAAQAGELGNQHAGSKHPRDEPPYHTNNDYPSKQVQEMREQLRQMRESSLDSESLLP